MRASRLRHPDAFALTLLLGLVLGVLAVNFWSRYNLYRLDIVTFYLPWYEHLGERLRDFDLPGWIPYVMSGAPFAGDPQSGWAYLPAMIFFTIAPSIAGYIAFVAFHVLLAAAGSYGFARVIGMNPVGAFAAGVAFTLGNFMHRTACCTIHMQVAVWIPVIFLATELAMRSQTTARRIGWLVVAGICTGQMVAGWVGQGGYYGCLVVAVYILYRTLISRGDLFGIQARFRALLVVGAVVGIVGGATAAPAVLPRLETVNRSNLADLYDDVEGVATRGWKLEAIPYLTFAKPQSTARSYVGAALLALTFIAVPVIWRRRHATFFALYGIGVVALFVRGSPLVRPFNLLPRFESLHEHSPDRLLVMLYIAPAILTGWLVHALSDAGFRARPHLIRIVLGIGLAISALVAAVVVVERSFDVSVDPSQIRIAGATIAITALTLLFRQSATRALGSLALIVLLIFDPAGRLTKERLDPEYRVDRYTAIVDRLTTPNGAARWLQDRAASGELFRYFGYDQRRLMNQGALRTYHVSYRSPITTSILVNNRGIPFELQDVQGYNPVQIEKYVDLMDAINTTDQSYHAANVLAGGLDSPLLDQLNVRYIVVPADIPPGRPDLAHLVQRLPTVYLDQDSRILENPNGLPRAWIMHRAGQEDSDEDILTMFALRLVDPTETVLLVAEPPELESVAADAAESVEVVSYEPDEVRLRVSAASTGMVVISEIWDPGWTATVDGERVDIYRANAVLRGVLVNPGEHEIVLRCEATTARNSLLFYLVPVAGLIAVPVVGRRRPAA